MARRLGCGRARNFAFFDLQLSWAKGKFPHTTKPQETPRDGREKAKQPSEGHQSSMLHVCVQAIMASDGLPTRQCARLERLRGHQCILALALVLETQALGM